VSMIITFVLIGKYLEVIGKKKAIDTLDTIKSTLPVQATVITENIKKIVSLDTVKIDDIVELKTGEKAGVDGTVISGEANFDESSITGESMPIAKTKDSKIYSGTLNLDGIIRYKATKNYANSTLNSIVTMIEDSLMHKPPIEKKANKASVFFSFTILSIAILTFFGWYYFDKELFYLEDSSRFETALIVAISVIVIACPCALALATPMASLVGISWLAKKNILFKEASLLETFAKANTLVLDKTGTITKGKMAVKSSYFLDKNDKDINILYSLVSSSTHPVSIAIKNYLEKEHETLGHLELQNFKTIQAKGIYAVHEGSELVGGNLEILNQFNIQNNINTNNTIFAFAINSKLTAYFELEDEIKENAKEIIEQIKNLKISVIMLTGDNEKVAASIADAVGIDTFYSNMTPFDKAEYIKSLKDSGKIVVMAGDGVNDALALSKSDIAITMGAGADISIAVSDVVLLNNSLQALLDSFKISKRTYSFIKQNLAISLIYNTVTIPLAVMGFVIPLVAALSMSLSSLLVVGNSMRIKND
ncbi:MAG: P-type Cu+ transporter, partial [Campylobacterota bacterium]|nr:P-type Cu+ transporter [Campylobacterota bacterium]